MPLTRPRPRPAMASQATPSAALARAIVPFDHAAQFELSGQPGRVVEDVISVSPEGVFVAVAIGYGFDEDRARRLSVGPGDGAGSDSPGSMLAADSMTYSPLTNGGGSGRGGASAAPSGSSAATATAARPAVAQAMRAMAPRVIDPATITLDRLTWSSLIDGFRVSPRFETEIFGMPPVTAGVATLEREFLHTVVSEARISDPANAPADADDPGMLLLQRLAPEEEISFLFSIIDSGSGRELQDQPTHNLASLGKGDGSRPFRRLAQPLTFLPRSTIRVQVIERMKRRGTLFIVLYGYKLLATSGCPEPEIRAALAAASRPPRLGAIPSGRVIPFDYIVRLDLTGRYGNIVEGEASINADGGFVATAIGYGLDVADTPIFRDIDAVRGQKDVVDLSKLQLGDFSPDILCDGLRVRPAALRTAFLPGGQLTTVPAAIVDRVFESLNRPENVRFRYTIADRGTGRDLQNRPIHNVAGLGTADGERPFKKLARPLVFHPRSTVRVTVEERFGRGALYVALQGYKVLGSSPPGACP